MDRHPKQNRPFAVAGPELYTLGGRISLRVRVYPIAAEYFILDMDREIAVPILW